jgi:hypothetical protein
MPKTVHFWEIPKPEKSVIKKTPVKKEKEKKGNPCPKGKTPPIKFNGKTKLA